VRQAKRSRESRAQVKPRENGAGGDPGIEKSYAGSRAASQRVQETCIEKPSRQSPPRKRWQAEKT